MRRSGLTCRGKSLKCPDWKTGAWQSLRGCVSQLSSDGKHSMPFNESE